MDINELTRRLENVLRVGVVVSVDHASARCVVQSGGLLSKQLPWLTQRAGATTTWWAPQKGEQVMLLSPGGDPTRGVVMPALYSNASPHPENISDDAYATSYSDGAIVMYDPVSHLLQALLPAGGKVQVVAPGGFALTGNLDVDGNVSVSGSVDADGDVTGKGVSLTEHAHDKTQPGSGVSGKPVAG